MAEYVETVVIGAGVIGLSVARALARQGREVLIVEKAPLIGSGASSRNSEVIHAGIYYPEGSLKAQLCLAGRQALYAYAADHGVPYHKTGKLIVAASEGELATLEKIRAKAEANGVDDLCFLTKAEAQALEPHLHCSAALLSPSTGIIDSHALMLAYLGDAQDKGAMIAFNTPVLGGAVEGGGIKLRLGGTQPVDLKTKFLINAAGLEAPDLARRIIGIPLATIPQGYLCKGSYFALSGRSPFSKLIYPVPEAAGLGVHLTLDLGGQARFGPDTEWVDHIDYEVDPARAQKFYAAIRRYWPGLKDGALQPAYAGIRPKISGPEEVSVDFRISGPRIHGVTGLVNLFGIESPGLTASLAIGEMAAALATGG
jgi:L-2-hydroxyglutarate oxidase LhgO